AIGVLVGYPEAAIGIDADATQLADALTRCAARIVIVLQAGLDQHGRLHRTGGICLIASRNVHRHELPRTRTGLHVAHADVAGRVEVDRREIDIGIVAPPDTTLVPQNGRSTAHVDRIPAGVVLCR